MLFNGSWHSMKKLYYFGYGMNTNIASMADRCPNAYSLGKINLPNHRLRFSIYADIVEDPHSTIQGALWEITDRCLTSLDLLEGYPNYYDRKIVTLERDDQIYDCWVYFMTLNKYQIAPPDSVYFDMVEQGYKDHGISNAQLYTALFESKEI